MAKGRWVEEMQAGRHQCAHQENTGQNCRTPYKYVARCAAGSAGCIRPRGHEHDAQGARQQKCQNTADHPAPALDAQVDTHDPEIKLEACTASHMARNPRRGGKTDTLHDNPSFSTGIASQECARRTLISRKLQYRSACRVNPAQLCAIKFERRRKVKISIL